MFVTNLTNAKLGVNGHVNLSPKEVNKFIDDNDKDLVARIRRLKAANLVAVIEGPGIVKTGIPGKVVKTIGVDTGAESNGPRSQAKPAAEKPIATKPTRRVATKKKEAPAEAKAEAKTEQK